jgi:ATP-dependent Clp protease ATP-binding subunit ClpA
MEQWRQIGESNYEVSDLGNIRNMRNKHILKATLVKKQRNYVRYDVSISIDGKPKNYKVHQLVARAWIENPDNKTEVDHIDRNTANNAVSNLRWATRSEQMRNCGVRHDNKLRQRNIYMREHKSKPFCVGGVQFEKTEYFATLDEAIAHRDSVVLSTNAKG